MLTRESILQFLASAKTRLFADFHLLRIGLFGSFAQNSASEQSDVDVLVEFQPNTEDIHEKKEKLRELLSQEFCRAVDICREKYIKPYFKQQILNSAIYV